MLYSTWLQHVTAFAFRPVSKRSGDPPPLRHPTTTLYQPPPLHQPTLPPSDILFLFKSQATHCTVPDFDDKKKRVYDVCPPPVARPPSSSKF
ncbi:hypothetical protein EVAR_93195_1 [Eumeta japonica]|uniref:Uncharacterized protein n=1 Tax=Eumeta variegata TaxID=151549 RepID=A0A4C1TXM8_EUMVA|nr:hypothetical protein EVAR_93195_1 [Eumeta japonica]